MPTSLHAPTLVSPAFSFAPGPQRRPALLLLIGLGHLALLLALTDWAVRPKVSVATEPLAVSLLASSGRQQAALSDAALPARSASLPAAPALPIPAVSTDTPPAPTAPRVARSALEPAAEVSTPPPVAPEVALTRVEVAPATVPPVAPLAQATPQRKRLTAAAVQYRVMPPAEVPRASRRAGESGTVWLRVVVDTAGVPSSVTVQRSSGFARLDEQAVWAMRQARFTPHLDDGRAVEVEVIAPVEYPPG